MEDHGGAYKAPGVAGNRVAKRPLCRRSSSLSACRSCPCVREHPRVPGMSHSQLWQLSSSSLRVVHPLHRPVTASLLNRGHPELPKSLLQQLLLLLFHGMEIETTEYWREAALVMASVGLAFDVLKRLRQRERALSEAQRQSRCPSRSRRDEAEDSWLGSG